MASRRKLAGAITLATWKKATSTCGASDQERDCCTCPYAIDTPDGWCDRHRLVVVFPCGAWVQEAETERQQQSPYGDPQRRNLSTLVKGVDENTNLDHGGRGRDLIVRDPVIRAQRLKQMPCWALSWLPGFGPVVHAGPPFFSARRLSPMPRAAPGRGRTVAPQGPSRWGSSTTGCVAGTTRC